MGRGTAAPHTPTNALTMSKCVRLSFALAVLAASTCVRVVCAVFFTYVSCFLMSCMLARQARADTC